MKVLRFAAETSTWCKLCRGGSRLQSDPSKSGTFQISPVATPNLDSNAGQGTVLRGMIHGEYYFHIIYRYTVRTSCEASQGQIPN